MSESNTPLKDRLDRLNREVNAVSLAQKALTELKGIVRDFPAIAQDIIAELQQIAGVSLPEAATGPWVGTNRDKIKAFFESRNNYTASVEEISAATGVPEASVRHVFSVGAKGEFEAVERQGSRVKVWRVVEPQPQRWVQNSLLTEEEMTGVK